MLAPFTESGLIQILHLEDNPRDAAYIQALLEDSGLSVEMTRVDTREGFLLAIENDGFDLIISDYTLPSFDGESAFKIAREHCPDIPFIFVSGTIGEETAVGALLSGATDYLVKTHLTRLGPAIRRALREKQQKTEERRLHKALLDSEAQYRQIVETTEDGIWKIDSSGITTFVNAKARTMVGRDSEDLVGKPFLDVVWQEDRSSARKAFERKTRQVFELRLTSKENSGLWSLLAATPIGEDGKEDGWLVMATDIDEKKRIEAQLLQSQKMDAIGKLAGGVAHDFNNLLQVILGYTMLARESFLSGADWEQDLSQVQMAAEKAAALARQLLTFGRRQPFEGRVVHLNHVVQEMIKMMERVIGEGIEIRLSLDETLDPICADPAQIEQVLMNLCVNARDAMPYGGSLLIETGSWSFDAEMARLNPWAREGDFAMLSLTDSGTGMEPDVLERIFEPFFTTKPEGSGTGLGLSTVFGIVKQHNGFIYARSHPGDGTTFEIYLPISEVEAAEIEDTPPPVETRGGHETILIAEDSGAVRSLTASILRSAGYEVLVASDGENALRLFLENHDRIELAILDMVMPRLDGRTLRLKMLEHQPGLKVLFTTGYARAHFSGHPKNDPAGQGAEEFLEKPYPPGDLLKVVRKILDRQ